VVILADRFRRSGSRNPNRPDYLAAWWNVVSWDEVEARFNAANNAGGLTPSRKLEVERHPASGVVQVVGPRGLDDEAAVLKM